MDLKPSPENALGYLFRLLFLSGYHLHNWQRQPQDSRLRLSLGACMDSDSFILRKRVGNHFKFLSIDSDSLGFGITHGLELDTDFEDFG